jgi:pentapeptide MXKDX repeat protein
MHERSCPHYRALPPIGTLPLARPMTVVRLRPNLLNQPERLRGSSRLPISRHTPPRIGAAIKSVIHNEDGSREDDGDDDFNEEVEGVEEEADTLPEIATKRPAMKRPAMKRPAMKRPARKRPAMKRPAMKKPAMKKQAVKKVIMKKKNK